MRFRENIPNFITLGNLLCGCLALMVNSFEVSLGLIVLAALLDFFDGMSARLLRVSSPLGKQLDSLADVVSFGVVPAYWVCTTLRVSLGPTDLIGITISYIPLLMALAGAWRLARFNIDESQSENFKGLPIPANGLFWVGFFMIFSVKGWGGIDHYSFWIPLLLSLSLLLSALMVSTLPLLGFKFKHLQWKGNEMRYLIIAAALLFTILSWIIYKNIFIAVPASIFLYIILSLIHFYKKQHEIQS